MNMNSQALTIKIQVLTAMKTLKILLMMGKLLTKKKK
jgi:hypothetical protein